MRLTIGFEDECFKLREGQDPPRGAQSASLTCARNDFAACSLVAVCGENAVLSMTDRPAFSKYGDRPIFRIRAACGELACHMRMAGMNDDDDGVHKADILLEGDAFPLTAGVPVQIFVRAHAGADCPAGLHAGNITVFRRRMFGGEEKLLELPFSVRVRDVRIPDTRGGAFHLDLWQHYANIARKHEAPLYSDAHFEIIEEYVRGLAELGQKAVTIIASDIPWSGQRSFNDSEYVSDLYEYGMIFVERDESGAYRCDYSVAERLIDLCAAYGIDREIEVFGLVNIWMDEAAGFGKAAPDWPDGIRVRYLDRADGTYRYMDKAGDIAGYVAALQEWFERKGWLDRVLVVADEPADIGLYRASLDALRAAAPGFRFKTAINHAEFIREFPDVVTDYVPYLGCVCGQWDALMEAREQIGGRLLWYVCCVPPYPNTFIGSPLTEAVLVGWLTDYMGMDGFMRWNYTVWPDDPRRRASFRAGLWSAGDTHFVYPSCGGRPLYTLRYWALRRGIVCFEMCRMVRARCKDAGAVLAAAYGLLLREPDMRKWRFDRDDPASLFSRDPDDYRKARELLLDALERCDREE